MSQAKKPTPTQEAVRQASDAVFERGIPQAIDAEKLLLGCILLRDEHFVAVSAILSGDEFLLESHKRVFGRMRDLFDRGDRINHTTLIHELDRQGQLESVGGLSMLVDLDKGLPDLPDISSYLGLVKEKFALREIIKDAQRRIDQALAGAESKDIAAAGVATLQAIQDGQQKKDDQGRNPEQVIEESGGILPFLDPSTRQSGIMTGFVRLDEATNGIHGGQLTLIGARPSVGKTSFALNVAYNVALKSGLPVHVYSLEMSPLDLLTRLVCASARVDQHKFRCGFLNSEERRRLQVFTSQIIGLPIILFDLPGAGVKDVSQRTNAYVKKGQKPALVVIDYIQLMRPDKKAENQNIAVGQISRGLKLLTRECDVPIWALSQLSRPDKSSKFSPPDLASLRDSGSLEQDADNVMMLWREEMVRSDREDLKGVAEVLLLKQRNGPITRVKLRFIHQFTKFENLADDIPEEPQVGW